MRKLLIILGAVAAYGVAMTYGPTIPIPREEWAAYAVLGAMLLLPIGGIVWATILFARWHRGFHARMRTHGFGGPR